MVDGDAGVYADGEVVAFGDAAAHDEHVPLHIYIYIYMRLLLQQTMWMTLW